ncbi:MAG TPA: amino acid ABC transporter substrate-binding protein [Caldilineae bacterium]|nr:amino acid ABC transporter substrate-binding protein [Caldilineae bacterium]
MTRRSWLIFAARMLLAMLGVALAWAWLMRGQDATWERLQKGEPLRVAMDPSFPPFESVNGQGELAGFDVDLAREIGRRLDAPVAFLPIAFDGLIDAVMAGKADVVISAFPLDERLTEDVRYSQPYFEGGLVVVTLEEGGVTSPEQLAAARVAVEWGGQGDAWARQQGLDSILRMETPGEALAAVASGQADAALVDAVTAALDAEPGLRTLAPPLVPDPYVIVLPKLAPKLADAIDEALADILTDGAWDALAAQYFPNPPLKPASSGFHRPSPISEPGAPGPRR